MTDVELTEEELALLELDQAPEDEPSEVEQTAEPKKRAPRKPKATKEADEKADNGPEAAVGPESQADDEPEPPADEPQAEPAPVTGPGEGHPHAMPAQHGWDDPWGQLPTQMRHDMNGKPAF